MSQARMFSRLQLAAALLEYDNNSENPNAAKRNAKESAIFAHLRPGYVLRPQSQAPRRSSDFLGVSLPSDGDAASVGGRASALDSRRSRASRSSIDMLRNPFAYDDTMEGEEEEEEEQLVPGETELDFSSWGLEAYMGSKEAKEASTTSKGKGKALQPLRSATGEVTSLRSPTIDAETLRRRNTRSRSVGDIDQLTQPFPQRRRSFGSPLDVADKEPLPLGSFRSSAYAVVEGSGSLNQNVGGPLSVPFPTSGASERSQSPIPIESRHDRTYSTTSMGSKHLLDDRPRHSRALSNATMGTMLINEDNPFTVRAPSVMSRFDPKAALLAAHERNKSTTSFGPSPSVLSAGPPMEPRQLTNMELLRPKVLVMPSPLQSAAAPAPPPTAKPPIHHGFESSTDGPPLPAGAKAARPQSMLSMAGMESTGPVASNSFTPNPHMTLSLSQLTFRNTLVVDGQRDAAYSDLELPSAVAEGEQAQLTPEAERDPTLLDVEDEEPFRPAGKLYGKSLIDDLENRKAVMRKKQRVFTGDQRPSMMNRGQTRSSTLIDPATLNARPVSQRMSSFHSQDVNLTRRQSQLRPLLNFDSEENISKPISPNHMVGSRSVFGVDTLWEREMAKLKVIEAEEAEERRRKEEEENRKGKRKGKGKNKDKSSDHGDAPPLASPSSSVAPVPRVSEAPPTLPTFESPLVPGQPNPEDSDTDSEEELQPRKAQTSINRRWSSGSSDDGQNKRATLRPSQSVPAISRDDSDEDLPLAATINRALNRTNSQSAADSDEERPLSSLLLARKDTAPSIQLDFGARSTSAPDEDEDDQPLGLRASRVMSTAFTSSPVGEGDDDDRPLGLHPDQQRRSQYNMMMAHQQSMMMAHQQAQLQSAMFLNPPSMNMSGFFSPMMAPMQSPMMPPVHDAAKLNRVDQWRKNVAVEGSE